MTEEVETNNTPPTLNEIADRIYYNAKAHGFWTGDVADRNLGEVFALIHSEVSEALEAHRNGESVVHYVSDANGLLKPEGWGAELVDTIIRCLDVLAAHGVNIDLIMGQKMNYNEQRPMKHGKAY